MNHNQIQESGAPFTRASAAAAKRSYQQHLDTAPVLTRKWGEQVIALGYTAVPDLLLSRMAALGLSPMDLVLLLQLMRYWWTAGQPPFPSKRSLAQAIGCSEKNVQKVMKSLEARGFVERIKRRRAADRNESNLYNLYPLVDRLREMAAQEAARARHATFESEEFRSARAEFSP